MVVSKSKKVTGQQWAEHIAEACEAFEAGDSSRARRLMRTFAAAPMGIAQALRAAKAVGADTIMRALDIYRGRFGSSDGYAVFNLIEMLKADGAARGANLSRLDLTGCTLCGADLSGADLRGAKVGRETFFPAGHCAAVGHIRFRPGTTQLLTVSFDSSLRVWDYETGALVYAVKGLSSWSSSAQYSPDGSRILLSVGNGTVCVLDADSGALQCTIAAGFEGCIARASFSPDGERVLTSLLSGDVLIFDSRTGERLLRLKGDGARLFTAQYTRGGEYILTAHEENVVRLWDAAAGRLLMTVDSRMPRVGKLCFSADNKLAAGAGEDRSVRIWRIATAGFIARLDPAENDVFEVSFTPERAERQDTEVIVRESEKIRPGGYRAQKHAVSADRKRIAIGYANGAVCIMDAVKNEPYRIIESASDTILDAAWSRNGRLLAVACSDCSIKIIDMPDGIVARVITECDEAARSVFFSPGGISAVYADGTVRTWDIESGELVDTDKEERMRGFIAVSRDGSTVLKKHGGRDAMVCDAYTGDCKCRLHGHRHAVIGGSFSADGRYVVTASRDNTAIVWESAHGCDLKTLRGHSQNVMCAGFSHDGARVLTGSRDRTAVVWDVNTGEKLFTLEGHPAEVRCAAYSPDDSRILTVCGGCVRIWDSLDGTLLDTLVNTAGLSVVGCEIGSLHPDSTMREHELELMRRAGALLG